MEFTLDKLKQFMLKAQAPHAFGTAEVVKDESDGSWVIEHAEGDWLMRDAFFGGQPYGGQETIFYKGKAVWIMVYYGRVYNTDLSANQVYDFLRKSLQFPTDDLPYRGPAEYKEGQLTYKNQCQGSIDSYQGEEKIFENDTEIYSATYFGGLVDVSEGVGY